MTSGETLRILRPHCPHPEVGRGRPAHQEKESSLRVIHRWYPLKEGLLFPGLPLQKIRDEHWLSNGNAEDLQHLLGSGSPGSPHHSVRFNCSRSSGQLRHPALLHTSSVPYLRLSVMQADLGIGQELLIHHSVHIRHTIWFAHCVDVIKESHDVLTTIQLRLRGFQRSVLLQCEEDWQEGVPLLTSLPLWNMLSDPSRPPTNMWMGCRRSISQEAFERCVPGDQIVRPDTID